VFDMKVAYALSGVGRGHTMRASALGSQMINNGYDVHFFSCCDAIEPLQQKFGVRRVNFVPPPQFSYKNGQLQLMKTSLGFLDFMLNERKTIIRMADMLSENNFDVVISDYEPLMARAANRANIPLISFNSQNFVNICKIPPEYKSLAFQVKIANAFISAENDYSIVSKPVDLPTKKQIGCLVGPTLRPLIEGKVWKGGGNHVLVYARDSIRKVLPLISEWAKANGFKVFVYGELSESTVEELNALSMIHKPISENGFVQDMITSELVVSTAGTQVIGEVAYLGCPSILIPEPKQREQELNASLASDAYPNITAIPLSRFNRDVFREAVNGLSGLGERHTTNGTNEAFEAFVGWVKENVKG